MVADETGRLCYSLDYWRAVCVLRSTDPVIDTWSELWPLQVQFLTLLLRILTRPWLYQRASGWLSSTEWGLASSLEILIWWVGSQGLPSEKCRELSAELWTSKTRSGKGLRYSSHGLVTLTPWRSEWSQASLAENSQGLQTQEISPQSANFSDYGQGVVAPRIPGLGAWPLTSFLMVSVEFYLENNSELVVCSLKILSQLCQIMWLWVSKI